MRTHHRFMLLVLVLLLLGTSGAQAATIINESFDGTTFAPSGWNVVLLQGTQTWTRVTAGSFPTCAPHSGAGMTMYGSFSSSDGDSARLITPSMNLTDATTTSLSFWMYHDPGYSSAPDSICLEYSTDGGTAWTAGPRLVRYAAVAGWTQHVIALGAFDGQASFKVAFKARNGYGNNMFLDDVVVTAALPYYVALAPLTQSKFAGAGTSADYHFILTNSGTNADEWVLSTTGASWPTIISNTQGGPAITSTGIIASAGTYDVWVRHTPPGGTAGFTTDMFTLHAVAPPSGPPYRSSATATGTTVTSVIPPLTESFTSTTFPPTGWSTVPVAGATAWTRNTSTTYTNPASTAFLASNGNSAQLLMPAVNLIEASACTLDFWYRHSTAGATIPDSTRIEVTTDNGAAWTYLTTMKRPGATTAFAETLVSLNAFVGNGAVQVRFWAFYLSYAQYFDDISIRRVVPYGVALAPPAIITATTAGAFSDFQYTLTNTGGTADDWALTLTGATWPVHIAATQGGTDITSTGTVAPGGTFTIWVRDTIPVGAAPGAIDNWVLHAIAAGHSSATANGQLTRTPIGIPYAQGFESTTFPPALWSQVVLNDPGTDPYWYQRPGTARNYPAHTAHGGTGEAGFNSYSASGLAQSALVSPPFDLTDKMHPYFQFYMLHDAEYSSLQDSLVVEVSTNGTTWTRLAGYNRYDATATTPVWRLKYLDLAAYADAMQLIIRLHGWSALGNDIYVDDFLIDNLFYAFTLTPDVDAQSAIRGTNADYTMTLTNTGTLSDSYTLAQVDGTWGVTFWEMDGTTQITTPVGPIAPAGTHQFKARVAVPLSATADEVNVEHISATSAGDGALVDQSTLTTTALLPPYAFTILAAPETLLVCEGLCGDYTVRINNNGSSSDTYTLGVAAGTNFTYTITDMGGGAITNLAVASGATGQFKVHACCGTIPGLVWETMTVTATSTGPGTIAHSDNAVSHGAPSYLGAYVVNAVADTVIEQTRAVYTLGISNLGCSAETYNLSVAGNVWSTTFHVTGGPGVITSLGPIAPGATSFFDVWVQLPDLAANATDVATVTAAYADRAGSFAATVTTLGLMAWRPVMTENLDVTNGGLTSVILGGGGTGWQWGLPSNATGPGTAHSTPNCWATGLNEDYPISANWALMSPPVAAMGFDQVFLSFYHWTYTENTYDGGNLKLSTDNGGSWTVVTPVGGYDAIGSSLNPILSGQGIYSGDKRASGWRLATFNLTAFRSTPFLLAWHFSSDASTNYAGWFVDDISLVGCVNYNYAVAPTHDSQSALRGTAAAYNITVTNEGCLPDTYGWLITPGTHGWTTTAYEADGVTPLANPFAVGIPLLSHQIVLKVDVPIGAANLDAETGIITFASVGQPGLLHADTVTTTAQVPAYGFALTIDELTKTLCEGGCGDYTLTLTNSGTNNDTYDLSRTPLTTTFTYSFTDLAGNPIPGLALAVNAGASVQFKLHVCVSPLGTSATPVNELVHAIATSRGTGTVAHEVTPTTTSTPAYLGHFTPVAPSLEGGEGAVITYPFRVWNDGCVAESYHLAVTGAFTYEIIDSVTGLVVSVIGPVAPGERHGLILRVFVPDPLASDPVFDNAVVTGYPMDAVSRTFTANFSTIVYRTIAPPIVENFDGGTTIPATWTQEVLVSGTMVAPGWDIGDGTETNDWVVTPHSPAHDLYFNSYDASLGASAALTFPRLDFGPFDSGVFSFWFYHYDGAYLGDDRVQVELSIDEGAWTVLQTVHRINGDPEGWYQYHVPLGPTAGGARDVRLRLVGISGYGHDCFIDDIGITGCYASAVVLTPTHDNLSGYRGETVVHPMVLSNPGCNVGVYTVEFAPAATWTSGLFEADGTTPLVQPVTVLPGDAHPFQVHVTVPPTATDGNLNVASVHAFLVADPLVTTTAACTTRAIVPPYEFTISLEPVSDSLGEGDCVYYTATLTNVGIAADSYTLTATSGTPMTNRILNALPPTGTTITAVGPLNPLASATFFVEVCGTTYPTNPTAAPVIVRAVSGGVGGPTHADTSSAVGFQDNNFSIVPTLDTLVGSAGTTVEYTFTLTNNGWLDDTYTGAVIAPLPTWTTTIWDATGTTLNPTLAATRLGGTVTFLVRVLIPGTITDGVFDNASIRFTSVGAPTVQQTIGTHTVGYNGLALPWTESFEVSVPPAGWGSTSTILVWDRIANSVNPTGIVPSDGSWMARANSFDAAAGNTADLLTPFIDLNGTEHPIFRFDFHRDLRYQTSPDSIRLSYNRGFGGPEYLGTLIRPVASNPGWYTYTVDFTALAGQGVVQMLFHAVSGWGDDMHLDNFRMFDLLSHDFVLAPPTDTREGNAGTTVQYSLTVTNNGYYTDTYDLETDLTHTWTTTIWDSTGTTEIDEIGPIANGQTQRFLVRVAVPAGIDNRDEDVVVVTATSQGEPTLSHTSTLTTVGIVPWAMSLTPVTNARAGDAGDSVCYTLTLSNLGDNDDSYGLAFGVGCDWTTHLYEGGTTTALVTPVAVDGGATHTIDVCVDIPALLPDPPTCTYGLTASSTGSVGMTASADMTTSSEVVPCLSLNVLGTEHSGTPTEVVYYGTRITNCGNQPAIFELDLVDVDWPTRILDHIGGTVIDQTTSLNPGGTFGCVIEVTIPIGVANGDTDMVDYIVTQVGAPTVTETRTLTTTANADRSLTLVPDDNALEGPPNTIVTYQVTLTNLGNYADIFNLSIAGNIWPTRILDGVGGSVITETPSLSTEGFFDVFVEVSIPAGTAHLAQDTVRLTASFDSYSSASEGVTLTTTCRYLHHVILSPVPQSGYGSIPSTVGYDFTLTNDGTVRDTFTFSASGLLGWTTRILDGGGFATSGAQLDPGGSVGIHLEVDIPAGTTPLTMETTTFDAFAHGSHTGLFYTTAQGPYGVQFVPDYSLQNGLTSTDVDIQVKVRNIGQNADNFMLWLLAGSIWPTQILDSTTGAAITQTGILASLTQKAIIVRVSVPGTALPGQISTANLLATSFSGPGIFAEGSYNVEAVVDRSVTIDATPLLQHGSAGGTVTYDVTVTNTGALADNFHLAGTGLWPITLWDVDRTYHPTMSQVLAFGESFSFLADVAIPADAIDAASDIGLLSATSSVNPMVTDTTAVTTITDVALRVNVLPPTVSGSAIVGHTATYDMTIRNDGYTSDTYAFDVVSVWPTTIWRNGFDITMFSQGVAAHDTAIVQVHVAVPALETPGNTDLAIIAVIGDGVSDTMRVTTTAAADVIQIGGLVTFWGDVIVPLTPIQDAVVTLSGDATGTDVTDAAGNYNFTGLPTNGEYDLAISHPDGGFNLASAINVLDAVKAGRFAAELDVPNPFQAIAVDVNNSGGADIGDLVLIRQRAISAITEYADVPDWFFLPSTRSYGPPAEPAGEFIVTPSWTDADITDADFTGIISGDVNGSWNGATTFFRRPPMDLARTLTAGPQVIIRNAASGSGVVATTTVEADSLSLLGTDIYGFDIRFTYDSLVVRVDSVKTLTGALGCVPASWTNTYNLTQAGRVIVLSGGAAPMTSLAGKLIKVSYHVIGSRCAETNFQLQTITFSDHLGHPISGSVAFVNGTVTYPSIGVLDYTGAIGTTVHDSVMAYDMSSYTPGCIGFQYELRWDPALLYINNLGWTGMLPGDWSTPDVVIDSSSNPAHMAIISQGSTPLSGTGALMTFDITLKTAGATTSSIIFPGGYPILSDEFGDPLPSCGRNGAYILPTSVIALTAPTLSDLQLSEPWPNPADGQTRVRFNLPEQSEINLAIYNVFGQRIQTLVSKSFGAGQYEAGWDATYTANGVYLLRLEANGKSATKQVTVQH